MAAQLSVRKVCRRDGLPNFLSTRLVVEMACRTFCPQGLLSSWLEKHFVHKACRRDGLPNFASKNCLRDACPTFCQPGFLSRCCSPSSPLPFLSPLLPRQPRPQTVCTTIAD